RHPLVPTPGHFPGSSAGGDVHHAPGDGGAAPVACGDPDREQAGPVLALGVYLGNVPVVAARVPRHHAVVVREEPGESPLGGFQGFLGVVHCSSSFRGVGGSLAAAPGGQAASSRRGVISSPVIASTTAATRSRAAGGV